MRTPMLCLFALLRRVQAFQASLIAITKCAKLKQSCVKFEICMRMASFANGSKKFY